MAAAGPIEAWKLEDVRKYLAKAFPSGRFDDYPRGGAAHLFVITEPGVVPSQQKRHQLLITRQFFDRFMDQGALRGALESHDVDRSLARANGRTVELY